MVRANGPPGGNVELRSSCLASRLVARNMTKSNPNAASPPFAQGTLLAAANSRDQDSFHSPLIPSIFPMARFARRLARDVQALALSGGRLVGSPGHVAARRHLTSRMRELGLVPYKGERFEVPYHVDGVDFHNLVGVIRGADRSARPVVIGAHYDSVIAAPCADDNASSVAIALSAAEMLGCRKRARDVIIALFDAEEPWHFLTPSMGSIRFYEDHLAEHGVHAALIMDLMGHDVAVPMEYLDVLPWLRRAARWCPKIGSEDVAFPVVRDLFFMTGAESHPSLAPAVESVRVPRRLRLIATLNAYVGDMSDHAVFRHHGAPYLFLSCGRWRHYHQETDTPEKLNYRKMERMMKYLVALTEAIAAVTLAPHDGGPVDTTAFEIRRIKKACGPALPFLLKRLGIDRLESRADIEAIASWLTSAGL
ncbi:MAG: M28 family peptidase [Planctomycetes bacterium]|nr:M28 family peptidase [Planctomycetota bacterium]